ncbi:MAG TPA: alkaline phosphatase family protein [Kofleriaceae bacterium]|nr:alkaline phosphatase family protein [Kofleriaceae bacterium]
MMKRRDALKTLGGIGAAAGMARFLPGCGGSSDGPRGITNYVYMMMENRSYDHFFGARAMAPENKGGNGLPSPTTFSNLDINGVAVDSFTPDKNSLCALDPPHGWDESRMQWNNGANDGFVRVHQMQHNNDATAQQPMQYLVRNDVPVSWALADAYATADRWFCAVMGPTWPNRFYWHAGTSQGKMDNMEPPGGLTAPSIYHRLNAKGIPWMYYYGNIPLVALYNGLDVSRMQPFSQFLIDAKAGTLPPVVYIDPAFNDNDDHPPVHPINGQELIASVYNALATSPQWKNCLLVLTYDEHGGFFDHVSPPQTVDDLAAQGFNQLGFRVPTLVAGPYVKQGYISSIQYEHCSALRELEIAFGLEPLNQRTMGAHDLSDFLDADRLARGDWAQPIQIPTVDPNDPNMWPMADACRAGTVFREDNPILAWADTHAAALGSLDLRPQTAAYRRAIRESLARPLPAGALVR